jgi:ubiquinone/menaquinone biosynthesis C-methylase UbiE
VNDQKPLSTATAIMDVGCGTGQALIKLVEVHRAHIPDGARIMASDFAEGMVEVFRNDH